MVPTLVDDEESTSKPRKQGNVDPQRGEANAQSAASFDTFQRDDRLR